MKRYITCTNEDGMSCKFGSSFSPFLLTTVDGIYKVENNITISNSNLIDGGIFQGSNITSRNIVLTVRDKDNHKDNREFLYRLFKPNSEGVLRYFENDDVKRINYYVESIDDLIARFPKDLNIIGAEMEAFALFYTAKYLNKKAACLLTVVDSHYKKQEISSEEREKSLNDMILLALESSLKIN